MVEFPVAFLDHKTDEIDLMGQSGNTFALAAIGNGWLRDLDHRDLQKQFSEEMFSGDYENVLKTMDKWFDTRLLESYRWDKDLEA